MMEKKEQPSVINYLSPFVMIALGIWHYIRHGMDLVTIIPIALGIFALYLVLFNHDLLQRVLTSLTKFWYPIGQFITLVIFMAAFLLFLLR